MSENRFVVGVPLLNYRSSPEKTDDNVRGQLTQNQVVRKVADSDADGWWEVEAVLDGTLTPGFVELKHLEPLPVPGPADVDAEALVDLATTFARQFKTSSVLLIGIAHAQSGLQSQPEDASGRTGLFGFRRRPWDELVAAHPETNVTSSMLGEWPAQVIIAAAACGSHAKTLKDALRRPATALEVYAAHHLGLETTKALCSADGGDTTQTALAASGLGDDDVATVLEQDPDILGEPGTPKTVADTLDALRARLAAGLVQAMELTHALGDEDLGALSRAHESNGRPGAIGFDEAGGWSYGLYQFASARGSVGRFLEFLRDTHADLASVLDDAGGDAAARDGTPGFKKAWQTLAETEPEFARAQHTFIKSQHFDKVVRDLADEGFQVASRSRALKDVVWSVSVQHGPEGARNLFRVALKPAFTDPRWSDDAAVINAVYDERAKLATWFPNARGVWDGLESRFVTERMQALAMVA